MADPSQAPGFKLPTPSSGPTSPGAVTQAAGTAAPPPLLGPPDTSARDMAVAAGILLVLLVAFFFAKNAYAHALVERKIAPRSANAGAWWLFILLATLASFSVLSFATQARFLTIPLVSPFALVALISLSLMLVSSRR